MSTPAEPQPRALDRFLAFGALTLAALGVISFFAIIIGTAVGMQQEDFNSGIWLVVSAVQLWGLPLGLIMMLTLLIRTFIRKGRAAKRS